jgi:serine/threonine protein kinase
MDCVLQRPKLATHQKWIRGLLGLALLFASALAPHASAEDLLFRQSDDGCLGVVAQFVAPPKPYSLPEVTLQISDLAAFKAWRDAESYPAVLEIRQEDTPVRFIRKTKKIGSGGMGVVYEIEIETTGGQHRTFAWKETKSDAALEERSGMRAQYSLTRATAPDRSHIVPVHEHFIFEGPDGGTLLEAYPMDLAGPNLYKAMSRGGLLNLWESAPPQTPTRLQNIFKKWGTPRLKIGLTEKKRVSTSLRLLSRLKRDMSSALDELAEKGLVHRDIKPDNIVIQGEDQTLDGILYGRGRFALVDFGLFEKVGETDLLAGTPGYLAPEAWSPPQGKVGPGRDIYSIATLLGEALTGIKAPEFLKHSNGRSYVPGFTSGEMKLRLGQVREELKNIGLSSSDLDLFDDLAQYVVRGLETDPLARMQERPAAP